ncbi:MAG: zinc ABC transporter substrate-binding protein ZnuA [Flavobacteriaceae bacterium]
MRDDSGARPGRRMRMAGLALLAATAMAWSAPAHAAISVVASIKPVHSLVAAVMEGAGEPSLIVTGSGSPHGFSLKPSQAKALEEADVVFWIGHGMENFLAGPLETLSGKAHVVELGDAEGLVRLPYREGGAFEAHDHAHEGHDHAHEGGDDHDHADGDDDHSHEEHAAHDHEDEHEHEHEGADMHLWLDPQNARAMVTAIAGALAEVDPDNAARYRENARRLDATLAALTNELGDRLEPVRGKPYIVFHDAYHYFEDRFGLTAAGSVTINPQTLPGAKRVGEIRHRIEDAHAACIFAEPQFDDRIVRAIAEGTGARTGVLDPLGASLDDGPGLYPALLRGMANSFADCLGAD